MITDRFEDATVNMKLGNQGLLENPVNHVKPYSVFRSSGCQHESFGFAARTDARASVFARTDSCKHYPIQTGRDCLSARIYPCNPPVGLPPLCHVCAEWVRTALDFKPFLPLPTNFLPLYLFTDGIETKTLLHMIWVFTTLLLRLTTWPRKRRTNHISARVSVPRIRWRGLRTNYQKRFCSPTIQTYGRYPLPTTMHKVTYRLWMMN